MLRTQIYIPEKLHQRAKLLAQKKNKPMADLLRQFIEQGLSLELKKFSHGGLGNITKLKIKGGPKDLSGNIDKYLYSGK